MPAAHSKAWVRAPHQAFTQQDAHHQTASHSCSGHLQQGWAGPAASTAGMRALLAPISLETALEAAASAGQQCHCWEAATAAAMGRMHLCR